ncbi:hypothetical protein A4X13_0g7748 [Tilletia indica]|uniref:Uncharacterized protein n=1 Tax=Tilletia indica TaxID=43049 RepID=A0A177TAZ5_9BASI|nr:hypothetical protein A4X13_0g7748 [Tilletia indica]
MPPSHSPTGQPPNTFDPPSPPGASFLTGRCLCPPAGRGAWDPSSWKDVRDLVVTVGLVIIPFTRMWTQRQRDLVAEVFMHCAFAVGPSDSCILTIPVPPPYHPPGQPPNTTPGLPCRTGRCLRPLPGRGSWDPSSWKDVRNLAGTIGFIIIPFAGTWTQRQRDRVGKMFMQCAAVVDPSEDCTFF